MIDIKLFKHKNLQNTTSFINALRNKISSINNFHTDGYKGYKTYFTMNNLNHTTTKDETTQVESFNSILRGFVATLVRRTKCVTHSIKKLYDRLYCFLFFYNKNLINFLQFKFFCINFTNAFS